MYHNADAFRVCLAGDWSIDGVAEQFPQLVHYVAQLSQSPHSKETPSAVAPVHTDLDISGITALDASGCQLLAHFSQAAQRYGMTLRICNIPDTLMAMIRRLGFAGVFHLPL